MGPSGNLQLGSTTRSNSRARANMTDIGFDAGYFDQSAVLPQLATLALGGANRPAVIRSKHGMSERRQIQKSRSVLMGAVMQLIARIFTAAGLVMQRAAAIDPELAIFRQVGITCYLITMLPDALSYLMAPSTLLTTLFGMEPLVVSVVVALSLPYDAVLITGQHSIATALCILGIVGYVLCAIAGSGSTMGNAANLAWNDHGGDVRAMTFVIIMMLLLAWSIADLSKHQGTVLSSRFRSLQLTITAAVSLALQRLLLSVLGILMSNVQWSFLQALQSPAFFGCVAALLLCTVSCCYSVIRGVREALPHIFVPLYTTISVLIQFFQSAVILRELRAETATDRLLLPVQALCVIIALLGIGKLHTAQHSRKQFVSTWGSAQNGSDFKCLAPVAFEQALLPQ